MKQKQAVVILAVGLLGLIAAAPESRSAELPDTAIKIIRVPNGGIQPQTALEDRGVMHMIYYAGDAKAGDVQKAAPPALRRE
jgi:hypothetical protein